MERDRYDKGEEEEEEEEEGTVEARTHMSASRWCLEPVCVSVHVVVFLVSCCVQIQVLLSAASASSTAVAPVAFPAFYIQVSVAPSNPIADRIIPGTGHAAARPCHAMPRARCDVMPS